ncbi:MAG: hypothetical protein LBF13_00600 [Campylobacteraceae bacterium]|jgi:hypothetical protein|nr:hypothetical protein [Campylobacteraceae bacterium]
MAAAIIKDDKNKPARQKQTSFALQRKLIAKSVSSEWKQTFSFCKTYNYAIKQAENIQAALRYKCGKTGDFGKILNACFAILQCAKIYKTFSFRKILNLCSGKMSEISLSSKEKRND